MSKVNNVLGLSKINVTCEKFEKFSIRVKHTFVNTPAKYIDKTIESMLKMVLTVKLKTKFDLYRFTTAKGYLFGNTRIGSGAEYLIIPFVFYISFYKMSR